MRSLFALIISILMPSIFAAQAPSWVSAPAFTWNAKLGGGLWYQEGVVLSNIAPALREYARPVLIGLRSDRAENGYRFDLDTFASNWPTYNDWPDRMSHERLLQTLGTNNTQFIWSIPTPFTYSADPAQTKGPGYPWQKPEYYAAYAQYLMAPATMPEAEYKTLQTQYDFFADASCTNVNAASEKTVGGNWANLRARRGHPEPYPIQAIILGIEPYGDAQEAFVSDGKGYGELAEKYRTAMRARGGPLATIPLGLTITEGGAISDFERPWFKPMLDSVTHSDFSYLDLHHHYSFGTPTNEINRIYPTLINAGNAKAASPGWQNWWMPREQWVSDFSRYLWGYEDSRKALVLYGETTNRWKIGCSEHGLAITSKFIGNDMGAGIHWALWLSEVMRYNAEWDMNWVLAEQGYAHAQLQFREGRLTRTPAHFVYKMAQEFTGLEYCPNTFESPLVSTGMVGTANYISPDVVLRVFRDRSSSNYHLFVINKNATSSVNLTDWRAWNVVKWGRISAQSFTNQNAMGEPWRTEDTQTVSVKAGNGPLKIAPISINHIELSAAPSLKPTVFVENVRDAKETPTQNGIFRITRTGTIQLPLTVNFTTVGTANSGTDYTLSATNSITIPAAKASVDIEVAPRLDLTTEPPKYLILLLAPSANYLLADPTSASVYVTD
jgi:hypothetical protein